MTTPARAAAPAPAPRTAPGRRLGAAVLPLLLLLSLLTAGLGMLATGALSPAELVPASPLVTWGLPVVRALHHLGLLLAVGAGATAVLLLPGPSRREVTTLDPLRRRAVRLGAAGALLWTLAALAQIPLGGLEATGAGTDLNVWDVAMGSALGRLQMMVAVFAALATLAYALARSTVLACWGLAFAGLGTLSLGLAGHAGASLDHVNAVNAMALHLVAVTVWAGGLLAIALLAGHMNDAVLSAVVRRFSPWALAAVVSLALSGLISAGIRLSGWGDLLTTGYGRVVLAKAFGLAALAGLGALQRARLGERLRFRHLALTEGVLMAAVIGASVALGRSAPPVPQAVPASGELRVLSLAGYLPPAQEFSPTTMFTVIQPDWIALALAATMAGLYLTGAVRLARRGDAWPWHRTLAFVAGCLAFAWVLSGGAAAWGRFRFDAHMVQHMAMMMIVPPLWVLGAPVTMLSRATAPRTDGSRGVREWVLAALHAGRGADLRRLARHLLLHPAVRARDVPPPRARADDGALPRLGLPLRLGADRHRPRAPADQPGAQAAHPARDPRLPRLLRGRAVLGDLADRGDLVHGPGDVRPRAAAADPGARRLDHVGDLRGADGRLRDRGRGAVDGLRGPPRSAVRPQGRARRRRRARRVQRVPGEPSWGGRLRHAGEHLDARRRRAAVPPGDASGQIGGDRRRGGFHGVGEATESFGRPAGLSPWQDGARRTGRCGNTCFPSGPGSPP
jgi:putative copper resistance protein D